MFENLPLYIWALIAEIAGTISGFGSSSILLPMAHQFFDYKNAIILVAIYHIFGNASRLSLTYQHWDKRIFFLFGIPSVIATILWASLVEEVNPDILKILLAIVLSIFALYSLWKPEFQVTPTPMIGRIAGALSGFTAWLIGTGGVLRGAFMTMFWLARERYIATIASIALLVDLTRIPLYFGQGFLSTEYLPLIPVLLIIAYIGSYIGKKIVNHIPTELLKRIILMGIILMSISLAVQWYNNL
jgi:uncharacterized membrane protein YfcA